MPSHSVLKGFLVLFKVEQLCPTTPKHKHFSFRTYTFAASRFSG
jgi:hypothetical protein